MRIPHFSGDAYLCRLKKTDIIMITTSRFFKERQYMWYKVRELQSKGLNKTQIGKHLVIDNLFGLAPEILKGALVCIDGELRVKRQGRERSEICEGELSGGTCVP